MSSEFHRYNPEEFHGEFFPEPADKAEIAAGMGQLHAEQRAFRLAEMRRRLGVTQGRGSRGHGGHPGPCLVDRARQAGCDRIADAGRLRLKLSAGGWRSSPTSATSAWPSLSPAPRRPEGHGAQVQMELRRRFRGEPGTTHDGRHRRTVAELLDAAAEARHKR
jgi:hypothetical protein